MIPKFSPKSVTYDYAKASVEYQRLLQLHVKVLNNVGKLPMIHKLGITRVEPVTSKKLSPMCSVDANLREGTRFFVIVDTRTGIRSPMNIMRPNADIGEPHVIPANNGRIMLELKENLPVLLGNRDLELTRDGVAVTYTGNGMIRIENLSSQNAYVGYGLTKEPEITEKEIKESQNVNLNEMLKIIPPETTKAEAINRDSADGHFEWFSRSEVGPLQYRDSQEIINNILRFPVRVSLKGRILGLGDLQPCQDNEDYFIAHFGFKVSAAGNKMLIDPKLTHYMIGSGIDDIYPAYELMSYKIAGILDETARLYNLAASQEMS